MCCMCRAIFSSTVVLGYHGQRAMCPGQVRHVRPQHHQLGEVESWVQG